MFKKPFLGIKKPILNYAELEQETVDKNLSFLPRKVLLNVENLSDDINLEVGEEVKTGQKLYPFKEKKYYITSSATGSIVSILKLKDVNNNYFYQVGIETREDIFDTEFSQYKNKPSKEVFEDFLINIPGFNSTELFKKEGNKIHTIVVKGFDDDPLTTNNQYLLSKKFDEVINSIEILKKITKISRIKLALTQPLYDKKNLNIKTTTFCVKNEYPYYSDHMITKEVLNVNIEEGKKPCNYGISFISVEAILNIKKAFDSGVIPHEKMIIYSDEYLSKRFFKIRIGTPIEEILSQLKIRVSEFSQIIVNGVMNGFSIYSQEFPIDKDTSSLFIISPNKVSKSSNQECINCGECIRVCPAKISCNTLIRFLEVCEYDVAEREHRLSACFECGLCAFVCPAKIPILQHIKLAKSILLNREVV